MLRQGRFAVPGMASGGALGSGTAELRSPPRAQAGLGGTLQESCWNQDLVVCDGTQDQEPPGNLFLRSETALWADTRRNSIFLMIVQTCGFGWVVTVMSG